MITGKKRITHTHTHIVMNIVKQLSINVELQVQHLSRPDCIEYCGTFLWKSSESELETLVFQKQTTLTVKKSDRHLTYLSGIYIYLLGHGTW